MWVSSGKIMLWGAKEADAPVTHSQYCQGAYTTSVGGIAAPFGTLMIASNDGGSNYSLAKTTTTYVLTFTWNTLAFKVSGAGFNSQLDIIQVETEPLASGAKANFSLVYDKAKTTLSLDSINYSASTNITKHKVGSKLPQVEDFRIDITNVGGSASNPVKIRSILVKGWYMKSN